MPSLAKETGTGVAETPPPQNPCNAGRRESEAVLVFLSPQVHRPLKVNFSGRFQCLPDWCNGYVFTRSSSRCDGVWIGRFRVTTSRIGANVIDRGLSALWGQVVVPLWRLLGRTRVDVIVTYDPYVSGIAGVILKVLFRAKLVVEMNGDYHIVEPSHRRLKRWVMRQMFDVSVRFSNALCVLNRDQEKFLRARHPGKRVYRFPAFTATEYFEKLQCYQGDYVLSVGYPFDLKGMDVLIRAFRRISEKHRNKRLRIMGYCPEREMRKYRELALDAPRIEFITPGWIEDVGEQIRGCYALVNAARSEAMGRVHLEAMACRKPVIATRTNGGKECVEEGLTGLLCEIGDVEDLADKLDYLLSNPSIAQEMGQSGFERLGREFGETRYASSFSRMIRDVVNRGTNDGGG